MSTRKHVSVQQQNATAVGYLYGARPAHIDQVLKLNRDTNEVYKTDNLGRLNQYGSPIQIVLNLVKRLSTDPDILCVAVIDPAKKIYGLLQLSHSSAAQVKHLYRECSRQIRPGMGDAPMKSIFEYYLRSHGPLVFDVLNCYSVSTLKRPRPLPDPVRPSMNKMFALGPYEPLSYASIVEGTAFDIDGVEGVKVCSNPLLKYDWIFPKPVNQVTYEYPTIVDYDFFTSAEGISSGSIPSVEHVVVSDFKRSSLSDNYLDFAISDSVEILTSTVGICPVTVGTFVFHSILTSYEAQRFLPFYFHEEYARTLDVPRNFSPYESDTAVIAAKNALNVMCQIQFDKASNSFMPSKFEENPEKARRFSRIGHQILGADILLRNFDHNAFEEFGALTQKMSQTKVNYSHMYAMSTLYLAQSDQMIHVACAQLADREQKGLFCYAMCTLVEYQLQLYEELFTKMFQRDFMQEYREKYPEYNRRRFSDTEQQWKKMKHVAKLFSNKATLDIMMFSGCHAQILREICIKHLRVYYDGYTTAELKENSTMWNEVLSVHWGSGIKTNVHMLNELIEFLARW